MEEWVFATFLFYTDMLTKLSFFFTINVISETFFASFFCTVTLQATMNNRKDQGGIISHYDAEYGVMTPIENVTTPLISIIIQCLVFYSFSIIYMEEDPIKLKVSFH